MRPNGLLVIVAMVSTACGESAGKPRHEAEGAVRASVPSGWNLNDLTLGPFEPGPATGSSIVSFQAVLGPPAPIVAAVDRVDGVNIVREILPSDGEVTVYGKVMAARQGDEWTAEAIVDRVAPEIFGSDHPVGPAPAFAPFHFEGSLAADALYENVEARALELARRREAARTAESQARHEASLERERQRSAAEAEQQRIRRQNLIAALDRRFDAATSEHGLRLAIPGLESWGTTLDIEEVDAATRTFSGSGVSRWSLPYEPIRFTGRIDHEGRLVLTLSSAPGEIVLEAFHDSGAFSDRRGGLALNPLSEAERERVRESDKAMAALVASPPTARPEVLKENRRGEAIQRLHTFSAGAVMRWGTEPATTARRWIDGDLSSYYNTGDRTTVGIRYHDPPLAAGIAILRTSSIGSVNAWVNGGERLALPPVSRQEDAVILIRFERPVAVADLRLELLGGGMGVREIFLVRPADQ